NGVKLCPLVVKKPSGILHVLVGPASDFRSQRCIATRSHQGDDALGGTVDVDGVDGIRIELWSTVLQEELLPIKSHCVPETRNNSLVFAEECVVVQGFYLVAGVVSVDPSLQRKRAIIPGPVLILGI